MKINLNLRLHIRVHSATSTWKTHFVRHKINDVVQEVKEEKKFLFKANKLNVCGLLWSHIEFTLIAYVKVENVCLRWTKNFFCLKVILKEGIRNRFHWNNNIYFSYTLYLYVYCCTEKKTSEHARNFSGSKLCLSDFYWKSFSSYRPQTRCKKNYILRVI